MQQSKIKDSALALGILFDKFRVSDGKADRTIEHKHTLSDLITKNSESNMTTIDVDVKVLDADLKENEIDFDDEE